MTKNKQLKNKTPFCKICFDFNKPEKEYTSHWVKDKAGPDGKVTCPYLLNMECRYCHEKGHLLSNCPILKQKKQKQAEKQTEDVVVKSPQEVKPPSLELLQQKLNVEGLPKIPSTLPPLPWLQQPTIKTSDDKTTPSVPTYADKCKAKTNKKTTEKKALKQEEKTKPKKNIYNQKTTEKKAPANPANKNKLSWADIMDDDTDDEENEPNNFWSIE